MKKIKMKFAPRRAIVGEGSHILEPRDPAYATGYKRTKITSKYKPHQGEKEIARRKARMKAS